ncbi:MAG: thioredoxin domain-containing protein [Candidatus Absconditabacterales bacterium]
MTVIHIESPEQFKKEVLSFDGISVIDFRAERCGPCRMLGPIMEELAEDNKGKKVQIVKVNVEQNPELSEKFQVSSIPVVFLMKGENPVDTIIGANPKSVYQNKIDTLVAE